MRKSLEFQSYPKSVFGDDAEHSRLDDYKSYARTYYVKMYAPADVPTVVGYLMKTVKDPRHQSGVEFEQIKARSKDGDDLDIRLGPASDHSKTLVMVWLTQSKDPQ